MVLIKEMNDNQAVSNYILNNTWAGAKQRVDNMELNEYCALCDFLAEFEGNLTETQINDFIWFDWDEIWEEMQND